MANASRKVIDIVLTLRNRWLLEIFRTEKAVRKREGKFIHGGQVRILGQDKCYERASVKGGIKEGFQKRGFPWVQKSVETGKMKDNVRKDQTIFLRSNQKRTEGIWKGSVGEKWLDLQDSACSEVKASGENSPAGGNNHPGGYSPAGGGGVIYSRPRFLSVEKRKKGLWPAIWPGEKTIRSSTSTRLIAYS